MQRKLGGLQNPPGHFGEENKFSFLPGFEQFVGCPVPSLVTVPSALFWRFSLLNKLNRVPKIPVVILNYTLHSCEVHYCLINGLQLESIPSHLNQVPFPHTVSPLSALLKFPLCSFHTPFPSTSSKIKNASDELDRRNIEILVLVFRSVHRVYLLKVWRHESVSFPRQHI